MGLRQLRLLGVPFLAIYGGEPTVRFNDLCLFVRYARTLGFQITVISDCIGMNEKRWKTLAAAGLDSVTVSLDAPPDHRLDEEKGRRNRSDAVLDALTLFYDQELFDDVEVVMTVGKDNLKYVLPMQEWCQAHAFWVHYDIQHPDRGIPGSKCRGGTYQFGPGDQAEITKVFGSLLARKKAGTPNIHTSEEVLQDWLDPACSQRLEWKCEVPWWLSVDCDGSMMMCDDAAIGPTNVIKVTEVSNKWEEFFDRWVQWRAGSKCSCFWATHMMAEEQARSPTGALDIAHGRS